MVNCTVCYDMCHSYRSSTGQRDEEGCYVMCQEVVVGSGIGKETRSNGKYPRMMMILLKQCIASRGCDGQQTSSAHNNINMDM